MFSNSFVSSRPRTGLEPTAHNTNTVPGYGNRGRSSVSDNNKIVTRRAGYILLA